MSTVPTNINNYLRQFAHQLEERILQQFPPLHQPGEPFPAELTRLRRTPYHAQALAIAGISKRWEVENSAGAIAECGTGKTLISLGAMFVNSNGRPFTALVMAPPQLTIKWCRETLLTLPRVRVFLDRRRPQRCGIQRTHGGERSAASQRTDRARRPSDDTQRFAASEAVQISARAVAVAV